MKQLILILTLISIALLGGCDTLSNFRLSLNETNSTLINDTINQTEQSLCPLNYIYDSVSGRCTSTNSMHLENGTNIFIFKSDKLCSFMVTETNETYLIDCGYDLLNIKKIKDLGFEKIDNFIITTNKDIDNILIWNSVFKPKKIYQTGIPPSAILEDVNTTQIIFSTDLVSLSLEPTFKNGLLQVIEQNAIIPYSEDIIYMSTCDNRCENTIEKYNIPFLVMSNNGECETNSLGFILKENPKYIISNANLCANISTTIDYLGIQKLDKQINDIQIIRRNLTYEIRIY